MAQLKPTLTTLWGSTGATTDPGDFKQNTGWISEIPPHQYQNFWQLIKDQYLTHINEQGICVHDIVTDYPVDAWAKGSDGEVYISLQTPNINQDPTSTPAYWILASAHFGSGGSTGSNANGYWEISPLGVITQWSRKVISGSTEVVTFPIPFTNASSISVTTTDGQFPDSGGFSTNSGVSVVPTTTQMTLTTATAHDEVWWIAKGV